MTKTFNILALVCNTHFSYKTFIYPVAVHLKHRGLRIIAAYHADGAGLTDSSTGANRHYDIPLLRSLNPLLILRATFGLIIIFRRERPDIVHCHMPITGVVGRIAAKLAGVPRIAYTCHGFLFNQPGPWWRRRLSLAAERFCGRFTDVYMTVSREEAEDAKRLRIHPNPIAVGNGRDPAVYQFDPEARARLRTEFGVAEDECLIVVVARLVEHKGWLDLLDALPLLEGKWRVWAVGDRVAGDRGPDIKERLQQAAAATNGRLQLLGMRSDIPAILSAADVFCLPSHFEGLPMSVIEAMMVGLPVVGTDIKGVRELVDHRQTGYLTAPAAPIGLAWFLNELIRDPAQGRALGVAGRQKALEHYTEDTVLSRIADLLLGAQPT